MRAPGRCTVRGLFDALLDVGAVPAHQPATKASQLRRPYLYRRQRVKGQPLPKRSAKDLADLTFDAGIAAIRWQVKLKLRLVCREAMATLSGVDELFA